MAKKKGNNFIIDEDCNIVKIELKRRGKESLYTIIDLEDMEKVLSFPYTWYSRYDKDSRSYYAMSTEYLGSKDGKARCQTVLLHQFILDTKMIVDHINHDTLDNRKLMLRITEQKENLKNRKGKNINNKSGYRNVCWMESENAWIVQLQVEGRNTRVGKFPKEQLENAGEFAKVMRQKYYKCYEGSN